MHELYKVIALKVSDNQGRGKCYQPKPKADADNTNRDLDYFRYHKNRI